MPVQDNSRLIRKIWPVCGCLLMMAIQVGNSKRIATTTRSAKSMYCAPAESGGATCDRTVCRTIITTFLEALRVVLQDDKNENSLNRIEPFQLSGRPLLRGTAVEDAASAE